ncbi:MAG: hypothetical protein QOK00_1738 [Thermoleophilaceae bacterium]|jgi:hypothetical protein|nr:hypothetical protein [Thermoleophilaceae bacterium]
MRLQRLSLLVAAAGVAVSACGSAEAPTMLDTEKVERAIERSSLAQRGIETHVSCPSAVRQRKGSRFSCTGIVRERGSTRFLVTQLDGSGHVRYEGRAD